MTIQEAARAGLCAGCMFRQVGPGPLLCLGENLGDNQCPGQAKNEKRQENEARQ